MKAKAQNDLSESRKKKSPKTSSEKGMIIPWARKTFSLSQKYISGLLSEKERDRLDEGQFNFFDVEFNIGSKTVEVDVILKRKEYKISCIVRPEHLSVACSCGQSHAICCHIRWALNEIIGLYGVQYFEHFYVLRFEKLTENQRNHLAVSNGFSKLFFKPHEEAGRVYGFTNYDQKLYESFQPLELQNAAINQERQLIYGIPDNVHNFPEPILMPYYANVINNSSDRVSFSSVSKSFLFENNEEVLDFQTANQRVINSACKEMLAVAQMRTRLLSSLFKIDTTSAANQNCSQVYKNHLLFRQWQLLIPYLKDECILAFKSDLKNAAIVRPVTQYYQIRLSSQAPILSFTLTWKEDVIQLRIQVRIGGRLLEKIDVFPSTSGFFIAPRNSNDYTIVQSLRDAEMIRQFESANFCISVFPDDFALFKSEILDAIIAHYEVTLCNNNLEIPLMLREPLPPEHQVHLFQLGGFLILKPITKYGQTYEVNPLQNGTLIISTAPQEGKEEFIPRDKEEEGVFTQLLISLHPDFRNQVESGQFSIPFYEVEKEVWLVDAMQLFQKNNVSVLGLAELKGLKNNPNPAVCTMEITGDQKYFDIELSVYFGDQQADLVDLRNCARYDSEWVKLSDGSLGYLPQDIREKLASLFVYGQVSKGKVHLSSTHFTTVTPFKKNITDLTLARRLELQSLEKIKILKKPDTVMASLRPYQLKGFSWMAFLRGFGWGGILADDMGLGKTLQVLTLLAYHYEQEPNAASSLIVLPNSLLFNWQQEIQKFTPHLQVATHHGIQRGSTIEIGTGKLILTTYGTLLSDIDIFSELKFSYLILDESQAIKTPTSKRFEAVQTIQSTWRLAMTGTPIENGISDLYAQLDFVNPGFLGTYVQFKKKFPGITDGTASKSTVERLQKLIAPFLLRRTKVQVAKDLPEKTEMVIYCDMLPEQRKIYEEVRKQYREKLEDKVEEGMDKASFFVMEGLMKLRQICNSPALVKNEQYGNHSIKLKEIEEHILDKIKQHKILLFSSFTATLGLLREQLDTFGIAYAYLDGKMNGTQRQEQVRLFQEEESCRVFLISLKAGGSGLNLTAADYVYIIDPWWNPAAEAQAIDRCYRIGQQKHVMAYKMICKDSIEEKIQQMQVTKKTLADTLIQTNNSILKSLNKADLLRLFD